ncbi:YbaN family protein [Clostridium sp.]|uniref:YbaN family protein n=1 Tax=Clostridium sp. TaxID=1506 RepID=UPI002FCB4C1C
MNRIIKYIYLTVGFIALGLGAIGAVLPIIPTTPFLLLASVCFARGSDKFNNWFKGTKLYRNYLDNFVQTRSMTLKQKVMILTFAIGMICIPLVLVDSIHAKIFIVFVIIFKLYYFIFRVKTVKSGRTALQSEK